MAINNIVETEIAKCEILKDAFANTPTRQSVERVDCSAFSATTDSHYLRFVAAIEEYVADLGESDYKNIRLDYTNVCKGADPSVPLPYESNYLGIEHLSNADCRIELARLYKKFGFSPADENLHEPEDFLPTLLGCLCFLYSQVLEAYERQDLAACLSASWSAERFKREHLSNWVPKYCEEARQSTVSPYYQGILGLLKTFSVS